MEDFTNKFPWRKRGRPNKVDIHKKSPLENIRNEHKKSLKWIQPKWWFFQGLKTKTKSLSVQSIFCFWPRSTSWQRSKASKWFGWFLAKLWFECCLLERRCSGKGRKIKEIGQKKPSFKVADWSSLPSLWTNGKKGRQKERWEEFWDSHAKTPGREI